MPPEPGNMRRMVYLVAGFFLGLIFCALNRQFFLWINGISSPFLDWIMLSMTHFGNGMVAAMIVLLLSPFRRDLTIRTALAMILAGILVSLVKENIPLPRPPIVFGDDVRLLGPKLKYHSFPSGHTATAFALACSLRGYVDRRLYAGALIMAVGVGISRMYIGVHFPLDVIIGALAGWFSARVTERYAGRLADQLGGPRPVFDGILLVLAALGGLFIAFFEPMVAYNPWFLRPLGIAGIAASIVILASGRFKGEPGT